VGQAPGLGHMGGSNIFMNMNFTFFLTRSKGGALVPNSVIISVRLRLQTALTSVTLPGSRSTLSAEQ